MNLIEGLKWRYATKKFDTNKSLTEEKINTIKEAFNLTATSFGLQPVKLVIISNKELQKKLVKHSMHQQQLAQASHVLVFCIERNVDENYIKTYFERVKKIRNTPEDVLKPFKDYLISDFEKQSKKKIKDWATKQAYLTMGNLLTVCAVEEIDACPMEGFIPKKYDKILKLKKLGLRSALVMPIGYRAKDDMFGDFEKVRKPLAESIYEIKN